MAIQKAYSTVGSTMVMALLANLVMLHLLHPRRTISIEISGSPRQTVEATYVVDGRTYNEVLLTPDSRTFDASHVVFWLKRDEAPEYPDLNVSLAIDGATFGAGHAVSPTGCACGAVRTASLLRLRRETSFVAPLSWETSNSRWLPSTYRWN